MSNDALKAGMRAGTQDAKKEASPVVLFSGFMDKMKGQLALALPRHMNADRMARLAVTAFSTTPALQRCSPQSIAASIMTAAQLGLEPNVNGQCYLVPYGSTCTLVPGWRGLVDLVARAGRATVWTGAVREGDEFEYQLGDEPFCRHKPGDGDDDTPLTHVYAIGRVKGAERSVIEVWTRSKVEKHLKRYNKVGSKHYAIADGGRNFEMYARKVALLQVLKYMPQSVELAAAIQTSHAAEAGHGVIIDGAGIVTPTDAPQPSPDAPVGTGGKTYADFAAQIQKAESAEAADNVIVEAIEAGMPDEMVTDLRRLAPPF